MKEKQTNLNKTIDIEALAWDKMGELIPAIVQDADDGRVLMQAYMNRESLQQTLDSGHVTFFSRSRQFLWTKGERSGNFLNLTGIFPDCDGDCLLVLARPAGPSCHRGTETCFDRRTEPRHSAHMLSQLQRIVAERDSERPDNSYTTSLFEAGVRRIAQKVGEEGVETALAAVGGDDDELLNESADLLYHLLVLLRSRELELCRVMDVLRQRHGESD